MPKDYRRKIIYTVPALFLIIAIFLTTALWRQTIEKEKKVSNFLQNPMPEAGRRERRQKVLDKWFGSADMIVQRACSQEALNVLQFAKDHNVFGEPHARGWKVIRPAKVHDDKWFGLVPAIKGDSEGSQLWKKYLTDLPGKAIGQFKPDERLLVLLDSSLFSETYMGIIFLHEIYHPEDYLSHPYDWKDPDIFSYHEVNAHDFQNRLTLNIGGDKYKELIYQQAEYLADLFKKGKLTKNAMLTFTGKAKNELCSNEIFEPAKSTLEENFRITSFVIHAYFVFAENNLPDPRNAKKDFLLKNFYKGGGIIPGV